MPKFVCIHGHFYQPPRENPWLEVVELQESAFPYHDWNSRITAQCYGPNSCSRITDKEHWIIGVVNNYSRISFNFGPTLLTWMEKEKPDIYEAILEADKISRERFSGHGSAIAQTYNHIIMPLANTKDKWTQVIWGIKDFEHRFKRKPEGMWLSETAVDLETLDILTQSEIKFAVLAPRQAHRVRKIGDHDWRDVSNSQIEPKIPYWCNLPSGKKIALFFYDGPVSQAIAFDGLLKNGEVFAKKLESAFIPGDHPQLVHIATDGESYGHHHHFGDMALAYALFHLESTNAAKITIYGEFLEKYLPTHEVEVVENSSWSCVHGIERWKKNCGCNSGGNKSWNQEWRGPLRGAMDWLRDNLSPIFESQLSLFFKDPWKARDDFISIVLDRSIENIEGFFVRHSKNPLSLSEKEKVLKLLEMQRNAMLMYTSCGWFFDEISGIEAVQVLRYAARAMQLARDIGGIQLEKTFQQLLERAPSNISQFQDGKEVYLSLVQPAMLDLLRVGVHFAVSSLFKEYPPETDVYSYRCKTIRYDGFSVGRQKAAIGKVFIHSNITWEENTISFAVFHLGDHNVVGGARLFMGDEAFDKMYAEIKDVFLKSQIPDLMYLIDQHFEAHNYSLWNLFKDDQRNIINSILNSVKSEVSASFQQIYNHHSPVMEFMRGLGLPLPQYFSSIVEFILNRDIQDILENPETDLKSLERIVEETKRWPFEIDKTPLLLHGQKKINSLMKKWLESPEDFELLQDVCEMVKSLKKLFGDMNLWREQNLYISVARQFYDQMRDKAEKNDEKSGKWLDSFNKLGDILKIRIR